MSAPVDAMLARFDELATAAESAHWAHAETVRRNAEEPRNRDLSETEARGVEFRRRENQHAAHRREVESRARLRGFFEGVASALGGVALLMLIAVAPLAAQPKPIKKPAPPPTCPYPRPKAPYCGEGWGW